MASNGRTSAKRSLPPFSASPMISKLVAPEPAPRLECPDVEPVTRHCTFCEIVARREPAEILYEDDEGMVFRNRLHWVPVMLLAVPKAHRRQGGRGGAGPGGVRVGGPPPLRPSSPPAQPGSSVPAWAPPHRNPAGPRRPRAG